MKRLRLPNLRPWIPVLFLPLSLLLLMFPVPFHRLQNGMPPVPIAGSPTGETFSPFAFRILPLGRCLSLRPFRFASAI